MSMIAGNYFDGVSAKAHRAFLLHDNGTLSLRTQHDDVQKIVELSSMQGQQLYFADGSSFVSDHAIPDDLRLQTSSVWSSWVHYFEQFTWRKSLILTGSVVLAILLLRWLLIVSAPALTGLVPYEAEAKIGETAFASVSNEYMFPSKLSIEQRIRIQEGYDALWQVSGLANKPRLYIKYSQKIGPNALAFPGGPIVVTDQLVNLLNDDDMVLAVLAHELGHVEARHALQELMIVAGSTILAATLFGAEEGISEETLAVFVNVYAFQHSQAFELESDQYAIELLRKANIDPSAMHAALGKLLEQAPAETHIFSTHPGKEARLEVLPK